MAGVGVGYDYGASTYSPAGRVFQVEYAAKAVDQLDTVIGIRCIDGVVLGVEKLIKSKMMIKSSYRRIFTTSKNSGIAVGGLLPDGRQIVNRAREEVANYKDSFGIDIPGKILSQRLSLYIHAYTEYYYLRPFGISVLLSIYDDMNGPQLYMIDTSGECYRYFAIAIGKSAQQARVELEKIDFKKMKCRDAVIRIAQIIYGVHDEIKDKPFELEISWICDESNKKHTLIPSELLEEAKKAGIKSLEENDESGEEEEQ